jgi:hypothetical protein
MLYGALSDLSGTAQSDVDAQYRTLEDYVFAELDYTQSKTCCWDTTTPAMAAIVLDQANVEQQGGQSSGQCVEPTVFRAMASSGDGYDLWRNHAQAMGRASDWLAWEQDETCPGANVAQDSLGPDQTDYCATLASEADAGAGGSTGDDGGGAAPASN